MCPLRHLYEQYKAIEARTPLTAQGSKEWKAYKCCAILSNTDLYGAGPYMNYNWAGAEPSQCDYVKNLSASTSSPFAASLLGNGDSCQERRLGAYTLYACNGEVRSWGK